MTERPHPALTAATIAAAVVSAQYIAGKAARDAIYLAQFDVTTLPLMVVAAAAVSIVLLVGEAAWMRRIPPARFVAGMFVASAVLLVAEWLLAFTAPRVAARLLYVHISGLGPILGSGFWLIATERFDAHSARSSFGRITGYGTLGAALGGLGAERIGSLFGAVAILPALAVLSSLCAWQVWRIAATGADRRATSRDAERPIGRGVTALRETPYLRRLAGLVFFGTLAATIFDYVFKAQTVAFFGRGEELLRFFSFYYAGTSVLTFVLQVTGTRKVLNYRGLELPARAPSLALIGGSVASLVAPGLASITATRLAEAVCRGSLYRPAYESFFTAIPPDEKRAVKAIIDVGFDRLGDAVGGAAVRVLILIAPAQDAAGVVLSLVTAIAALVVTRGLDEGYQLTLVRNIKRRMIELELTDVDDLSTRSGVLKSWSGSSDWHKTVWEPSNLDEHGGPALADPVLLDIAALRARERHKILAVLERPGEPHPALISHIVPLLARDSVSRMAILVLRRVVDKHLGVLADALLDPEQPFAVRRRVARVLCAGTSDRTVDALVRGLHDHRFEVRYNCARSLVMIRDRQPGIAVDSNSILDTVRREIGVEHQAWNRRQLHDQLEPDAGAAPAAAELGSSHSVAHVFTLLSLVLPAERIRSAVQGLGAKDPLMRGAALEILDGLLPRDVRDGLWPLLDVNHDSGDDKDPHRP